MSTESPTQDGRRSAPSAAERMRAVRKRRRLGSFFVRIELNEPDIDGLIRLRLLRRVHRHDTAALQVAVRASAPLPRPGGQGVKPVICPAARVWHRASATVTSASGIGLDAPVAPFTMACPGFNLNRTDPQ